MTRVFLACVAAGLIGPAALAQAASGRLDTLFAAQQGTNRPGCAVSIVDRGRLVVARPPGTTAGTFN